jgi:glutamine amidotransferase
MGNIRSVENALNYLGVEYKLIDTPEEILESEKLIIPGVGSFRKAMENMKKKKFIEPLNEVAMKKKIPILGICLGMQLMAEESQEDGLTKGLGWIKGSIKKIPAEKTDLKVPHVGFNEVIFEKKNKKLYEELEDKGDFYYVHSYMLGYDDCDCVSGWTEYGKKLVGSIEKDNIFGTQFHPEKSQSNGLIMLKNFVVL